MQMLEHKTRAMYLVIMSPTALVPGMLACLAIAAQKGKMMTKCDMRFIKTWNILNPACFQTSVMRKKRTIG